MPAPDSQKNRPHRPKALMVFATAFIAGAVAAVGINRALDVHLAQSKPKVESEPIFVALRSLPQGTPVTIWDVALRDWPKAMMPSTALRAHDHFEGMILRHPVREGQPLLSVQLATAAPGPETIPAPMEAPIAQPMPPISQGVAAVRAPAASAVTLPPAAAAEADLWAATPEPVVPAPIAATAPAAIPEPVAIAGEPTIAEPPADAEPPAATEPAEAVSVVTGPPAAAPVVEPQPTIDATTPAPAQAVTRYLVVPERIAMQADNSFVTPAASAVVAAAAAPAKPPLVEKPTGPTKNVPPVVQHPGSRRPQPGPTTQRAPQAKQPPARTSRPQGTSAETSRPQGMFGTMFPSLRAGIEAVEAEMRSDRQPPTTGPQPSSQPRKNKPHPPSQSAAGWPRMGSSPRSF